MKKAEEYAKEFIKEFFALTPIEEDTIFWKKIIEKLSIIIKQVQIDTIKETIKSCIKDTKMFHKYYSKEDKEDYKKYCEFKGTYPERYDSFGNSTGVDVFQIDQESILNIEKQLKKELE